MINTFNLSLGDKLGERDYMSYLAAVVKKCRRLRLWLRGQNAITECSDSYCNSKQRGGHFLRIRIGSEFQEEARYA